MNENKKTSLHSTLYGLWAFPIQPGGRNWTVLFRLVPWFVTHGSLGSRGSGGLGFSWGQNQLLISGSRKWMKIRMEVAIFEDHFFLPFSPNKLLWGSFLGKKLAAICSGRVPGACLPCVCLVSALSSLWQRLQTLSALCPPCVPPGVRFESALGLSTMRPPCVGYFGLASSRLVSALVVPPNLVCHVSSLPFVRLVSFMCAPCARLWVHVSAMRPPCDYHVSALCPPLTLNFVNSWPPSGKILSHLCTAYSVYIACPLGHFGPQIRPLQACPMLEKLFGVYAGIV